MSQPQLFGDEQVAAFEASGGLEANTLRGVPIIVLTTTGARSGAERKVALMRVEHDGRYAVVASRGGSPEHPAWYHNLVAHPRVQLQDGPVRRTYDVRELAGAEREDWWARSVEVWPDYATYQTKTDRVIPVLVLEPVADEG
ncbi:nitroreductase family deazaflavin-dependent oxidoreductase [Cellulomonas citrea]|uniref:nitroreductase family deazaflavin-dependent oxidoreductase n=1 Tax=Cellulomonas citrea TaxID=1909423 RepID=UPI001359A531|nr:nitroreductase family deazaflavin-dependent oxidoreductase [Cellulomonas citrea]